MLTDYQKRCIAHSIFDTADLGSISKQIATESMMANKDYPNSTRDYLTSYIVESVNNATEFEDIETDLNYAINQFKNAIYAYKNGKLL